jgi:hypothetical protein
MSIDTTKGHKDMDYPEHLRTYDGFLRLTKITIGTVVIVLSAMAYFLIRH